MIKHLGAAWMLAMATWACCRAVGCFPRPAAEPQDENAAPGLPQNHWALEKAVPCGAIGWHCSQRLPWTCRGAEPLALEKAPLGLLWCHWLHFVMNSSDSHLCRSRTRPANVSHVISCHITPFHCHIMPYNTLQHMFHMSYHVI